MKTTLTVACLLIAVVTPAGAPIADAVPSAYVPPAPSLEDVPRGTSVATPLLDVIVAPAPPVRPRSHWVWARVTACSPQDPGDGEYYAENGYEGAIHGIAASPRQFRRGTRIHVPGYMDESYPDKFWPVDSHGGPYIRESAARGIVHIDVKFRTLESAAKWGVKRMKIEVMDQ